MSKLLKSVLALMLVLMLVLAGCSTGSSDTKEDGASETATEETAGETTEETADAEGPVTPEHEFPIVKDKIELTVMVPSQTSVEDMNTNDFTTWYEEQTNIHINWNVIPSDSATDKVNISLASKDFPDIYMDCGITLTQQAAYGGQGAFIPLNDLIDKYSTTFQSIMDQVGGLEGVITMGDGNIYCLPYLEKCQHCECSSKMWYNTEWLATLGLEKPTTTDEFKDMLVAFKENDPNGNGANDEVPLLSFDGGWHSDAISGWLTDPFVYTSPDNNYAYLDNGTIKFAYAEDGWKDAMAWIHELYAEGLYYDQSMVINNDQARQVAASAGEGVAVVGCFPNGVPSAVPGDTADYWGPYQVLDPVEGPAGRYCTWTAYSQITPTKFLITSVCEYPEAAFRWGAEMYNLDICFRKGFGIEGTNWKLITPGEDGIPADAVDTRSGNPSEAAVFADGVSWGDAQNFCWRGLGLRCDTTDVPDLRYDQYQPGDYETDMEYRLAYDTRDYMEPYRPDLSVPLPPMIFSEEQAAELANTESVILTYIKESAARFITGDADVEAEWATYTEELNVKGLENLQKIYQDAYEAKYGNN